MRDGPRVRFGKKARTALSVLGCLPLPFFLALLGPLEAFSSNREELGFAAGDFLPLCILFGGLAAALLFAVGIPFLLPHMHERYFFGGDVLSVVLAYACPLCIPAAALTQFASLLGYHAYLKMRYLLYVDHGARALIGVLAIAAALLFWETREKPGEENSKNLAIQP